MAELVGSGAVKSEETTVYGFETWGDRIDMMLEVCNVWTVVKYFQPYVFISVWGLDVLYFVLQSKNMGRLVIRAGDGTEKDEL